MYVYRAQACLASSVIYSCCFYLYLLYVLVMKLWCNCLQGDLQSHVQDHLDFRPQASLQSVRQISMNSVSEVAISKTWWVCFYLTPPPPPHTQSECPWEYPLHSCIEVCCWRGEPFWIVCTTVLIKSDYRHFSPVQGSPGYQCYHYQWSVPIDYSGTVLGQQLKIYNNFYYLCRWNRDQSITNSR